MHYLFIVSFGGIFLNWAFKIFQIFCERFKVSQIFRLNTFVALPQMLGNLICLMGNLLKQTVAVVSRIFLFR
jgi:hypothetical protein